MFWTWVHMWEIAILTNDCFSSVSSMSSSFSWWYPRFASRGTGIGILHFASGWASACSSIFSFSPVYFIRCSMGLDVMLMLLKIHCIKSSASWLLSWHFVMEIFLLLPVMLLCPSSWLSLDTLLYILEIMPCGICHHSCNYSYQCYCFPLSSMCVWMCVSFCCPDIAGKLLSFGIFRVI